MKAASRSCSNHLLLVCSSLISRGASQSKPITQADFAQQGSYRSHLESGAAGMTEEILWAKELDHWLLLCADVVLAKSVLLG